MYKFILMSILLLSVCSESYAAATRLFKSNFGKGVTLAAPSAIFPTGTGAWRYITGTDQETGSTWPPKIGGGINFSALQIITRGQVTSKTIGNYYEAGIRQIPELQTPIRELYQIMKEPGVVGDCCDQIPLILQGGWKSGDIKELYISYWFRHRADLAEQLRTGGWRVQFEFKTGGYNNTSGGDYRIGTTIRYRNGKLVWVTEGDTNANAPVKDIPIVTKWKADNSTDNIVVPVPTGQWFKYEIYWKRSAYNDGHFWSAVNGQVIVNRFGPNMGKFSLPITRIMVNNAYSGAKNPVESRTTGFEVWSSWPCGIGKSCYKP